MCTNYIGDKREYYLRLLEKKLKPERLKHTLRTEQKALYLARLYGEDLGKTQTAALLHDILKNISEQETYKLAKKYNIDDFTVKYGKNLLHGLLASYYIKEELNIDDEDVINAVKNHTAGRADMSRLEKIIYLADMIEDGRDFPGVGKLRELSEKNLDEAVFAACRQTMSYLISICAPILGGTAELYNDYATKEGRNV